MTVDEVWEVIEATLAALPDEFRARLQYTVITVDDGPPRGLLGLYEGVPESASSYAHLDTITLFKQALEREASSPEELRRLIRQTLLHEIGHHFGLSEDVVSRASYPENPEPPPP